MRGVPARATNELVVVYLVLRSPRGHTVISVRPACHTLLVIAPDQN
jgi:hypothetical protein